MRTVLIGMYSYGTIRVSRKTYMHNNHIPLRVRASLAIQPIMITPFMFPMYILEDTLNIKKNSANE